MIHMVILVLLLTFGRPFVKRFALCYQTVVLTVCPACKVGALWQNGWMDQDETWYGGRPRPRRHCLRWGTQLPIKRAHPHFSAHVYCGQTVAHFRCC